MMIDPNETNDATGGETPPERTAARAAVLCDPLAAFIRRYAERHEVRIDGSDLWEGRCRHEDDPEMGSLPVPEAMPWMQRHLDHYLGYPLWEGPPPGFGVLVDLPGEPVARVYANDATRCYVALVGRVVYVTAHAREVRYRLEREYIQEAAAEEALAEHFRESGFR